MNRIVVSKNMISFLNFLEQNHDNINVNNFCKKGQLGLIFNLLALGDMVIPVIFKV